MIEPTGDGRFYVGDWASGIKVVGGGPLDPVQCWAAILRFNELLTTEEFPPSPFIGWTENDLESVFAYCKADPDYPVHILECARQWIAAGGNAQ